MVASSLLGVDRAFGGDTDAACGDDELAVLVAMLGDALAEDQFSGALAFLLPDLALLGLGGEDVAGPQRPVIDVFLLGVQAARRGRLVRDAGCGLARAEPRLAGLRPQPIFGIE